jgi:acyl-CoA synthetase (AMP-forming)/AMP-acid ligase II
MGIGMLLEMATAYDDRVALSSTDGDVTYAELSRLAAAGGELIRAAGAGSVAFVDINGPALPILLFSSAGAGVPLCPLNYRLPFDQIEALLSSLDRPLVIADGPHLPALRAAGHTVVETGDWLERTRAAVTEAQTDAGGEGEAVLLFTSGTTSAPKCVVLKHAHLVAYVVGSVEFAGADPDDCALVSLPPYHVAGVCSALTNVYAGRRIAYLPDFSPQAWLDLVRSARVTSATVVPTMLARIVEHLGSEPAAVPSLRTLAYGGARMPIPLLERALAAFPDTGFVNAYGLTETSSTIAVLEPDDHRAALAGSPTSPARTRLASVGRVVPGMEAQVRDDAGTTLPAGVTGSLWVRGDQVSGHYRGTGSALDADGWFATNDRAFFDADGYLFLEGRSDDTIIRGAENISPAEIEDVLLTHPAIAEAAVVGVPDEEWGERIVALVVPVPGAALEPAEVREFARARLRGSRTPDQVEIRGELPYTPTGKLLRRHLVAELTG